jgi:hypothetical protein
MKKQSLLTAIIMLFITVVMINQSSAQTTWRTTGNPNCATCVLGTKDLNDLDFITNDIEQATISSFGNFGIGTTGPQVKLHVDGGTDTELGIGGFLVLGSTAGLNVSFDDNEIEARSNGAASTLSLQNDGGDLNVSAGGLYVQANNDVGIGTTAPLDRLHIAGEGLGIRFNSGQTIKDATASLALHVHAEFLPDATLVHDVGTSTLAWDDMNADNFFNISDRKEKENIRELTYGLNEIMKLKPVNYTMKKKAYDGNKIGFIAQDMHEVIPEVVGSTDWRENEKGEMVKVDLDIWGIDYGKLTSVLVKGMQEQQAIIEAKDQQLTELESTVAKLQNLLVEKGVLSSEDIAMKSTNVSLSSARLEQNAPNPFSTTTIIKYFVPDNAGAAEITIADQTGKVMRTISLNQRGAGQIVINAFELTAGTYSYFLTIDGRIIDSKQMVLTR